VGDKLARLAIELATAGVPVTGITPTGPNSATITYASFATNAQKTTGAAVLAAFNWSDAAQKAWETKVVRDTVLDKLFTDNSDGFCALRLCVIAAISLVNQRLTALGQPAVTKPQLVQFIKDNPTLGDV
jgi:hypothetical protein